MVSSLCSCDYFDTIDELRNGKAQEDYHTRSTESSQVIETSVETQISANLIDPSGHDRYVGGEANKFSRYNAPSVGEISFPVFMVEFADVGFVGNRMSKNDVSDLIFGEDNYYSLARRLNKSSYGRLSIEGNVYMYTTQYGIDYYKNDNHSYETLAMEVLDAFDDEIDYSEYDSDNNGVIDFFVINVAGEDSYYRGCTSMWWENQGYKIDNEYPAWFVLLDVQPFSVGGYQEFYVEELMHEMGHCFGLPDYYIRGEEYDIEGFDGDAGNEMMDEMTGDFGMFSKIMLGWVKDTETQIYSEYNGVEQTFIIYPTDVQGSCLIIPQSMAVSNIYLSEYFLVEYYSGEGVRAFHIDSSAYHNRGMNGFDNSNLYPDGDIRLITLINNGDAYMQEGDVIDFTSNGFGWYGDDKTASVDSGYSIRLDDIDGNHAVITVFSNN